jgi:hypothetical protein
MRFLYLLNLSAAVVALRRSDSQGGVPQHRQLGRRQDDLAGFKLLGPDAVCFDFELDGSRFTATCLVRISTTG